MILLLAFAVVTVALVVWFVSRPNEPEYRGKKLSQWIAICRQGPYEGTVTDEAYEAIRQIGTNAIPYLMRELQASEYPWENLERWLIYRWDAKLRLPTMWERRENARIGFEVLGTRATSAIPALLELCAATNLVSAVPTLAAIGDTNVLPMLVSWLTNSNPSFQREALRHIGDFGGKADFAVPFILPLTQDTSIAIRHFALRALGKISSKPRLSVPALTNQIGDPIGWRAALESLAVFGTDAAEAIPAVAEAAKNKDPTARLIARRTLVRLKCEMINGGIIRGSVDEKRLAIVFTGHEFAEGGNFILEELSEHRAKASFFLTGDFLATSGHTQIVQRIAADNHFYGIHSDKHLLYCAWDKPKTTLVTKEDFTSDLQRNYWRFQQLGLEHYPGRYFIPPFEHYNRDIVDWARNENLTLINFTAGTRSNADYTGEADTNFVSSQVIFDSILKREREDPHGLNGFILLLHLGSGPRRQDKFHTRFGELLAMLAAKGYQFVRVDELLEPPKEKTQTTEPVAAPNEARQGKRE